MKVTGGLVGITLNPSARAKFFLIAPELARLANQAKEMAGVTHETRGKRHNLTAAVVSREEKNIIKLSNTIRAFTNPFSQEGADVLAGLLECFPPRGFSFPSKTTSAVSTAQCMKCR